MAFAATTVTVSDVTSSAVERSNSELYGSRDLLDDTRELKYVTFNIPVSVNNGTMTVEDVSVNIPSSFRYDFGGDLDDSYIVEKDTTFPLEITNKTETIRVRVLVPENLDAIDSSFNKQESVLTADLAINNGTDNIQRTSNLKFSVENNLEVRRVNILVDGNTYRCSIITDRKDLDCDGEVSELEPGRDFDLELQLRNNFRSASKIDIEDIEIDLFDERDVEADRSSYSERRLRSGDDLDLTIGFKVDSRVEDGDRAIIEFTGYGIDVNGARHGFEYEFEVRFRYPRAKVEVSGLSLSSTNVCPGDRVTIRYDIENHGTDDQPNIRSKIEELSLDLERIISSFKLDSRDGTRVDSKSVMESFTVPQNTALGDYSIKVHVYHRDDRRSETDFWEAVVLRVKDCDDETIEEEETGDNGMVVNDSTSTTTPPPTTGVVTATAKPKSNDALLITGLVVLVVLLAGVFVSLILVLKK
jgi:hypothetical protein